MTQTNTLNETQLIICVLFIGAIAHLVAYQIWATRGDRGVENYDRLGMAVPLRCVRLSADRLPVGQQS